MNNDIAIASILRKVNTLEYTGVIDTDAVTLYNAANDAYEKTSEPILTDIDFDILKAYCIDMQLIEYQAGAAIDDSYTKKDLAYPMLSIQSIHQQDFADASAISKFLQSKYSDVTDSDTFAFDIGWKLDGLAIQILYEDGKLLHALTRGERIKGIDVTDRLRHVLPKTVDKSIKAIIGEVVIPVQVFEDNLSHIYKNERNAAAGLINSSKDPVKQELCKYLDIVAFKLLTIDDEIINAEDFSELVLDADDVMQFSILQNSYSSLNTIWNVLDEYQTNRSSFKYRTDGVVIINIWSDLNAIHAGLYTAYTAFKFKAVQAKTTILSIDFRLRNNGDLFPRAILQPVELDGTTVRHVSLFNYGNMLNAGLFPGAEIIIVKSGDIIPNVELVTKHVYETQEFRELHSLDECVFDGVNMKSNADVRLKRFISGIHMLDLKDVGTARAIELYDAGYTTALDLFDYANTHVIVDQSKHSITELKTNAAITNRFKSIHLDHLIVSLREIGIGHTSSKNIALYLHKFKDAIANTYDLYLNKVDTSIIATNITQITDSIMSDSLNCKFNKYEREFFKSIMFLQLMGTVTMHFNRIVFIEEQIVTSPADAVKIMLTGSPKSIGFATKAIFLEKLAETLQFVEVNKIKDCDILIADSVDGNSNKLKQARDMQKSIATYSEILVQ
jgi:NAD-dependent DNA ligase